MFYRVFSVQIDSHTDGYTAFYNACHHVFVYIFGSLWRWSRGQQNHTPSLNRLYIYIYMFGAHLFTKHSPNTLSLILYEPRLSHDSDGSK